MVDHSLYHNMIDNGNDGSDGGDVDEDHAAHRHEFENAAPAITPLHQHVEQPHHSKLLQQDLPSHHHRQQQRQQRQQHYHQYESLASLLLRQQSTSSFGIEGGGGDHNFHGNDDESCNHYSDNDSTTSNNPLLNDRDGKLKSCCFNTSLLSSTKDSPRDILVGMIGIFILGIVLGIILPSSSSSSTSSSTSPAPDNYSSWNTLSNILGYTYFLSWTCSFYPQIITNWYSPTEANHGVSLDFCVWNIVGFMCYAIYTTCFRFSDVVRMEYAHRFGRDDDGGGHHFDFGNSTNSTLIPSYYDGYGSSYTDKGMDSHGGSDGDTATNDNDEEVAVVPQVQINDVAFAWHALLLATIAFVQLAWFSGGRSGSGSTSPSTVNTHQKDTLLYWTNRISPTTKFLILILLVVCVAGAIIVACHVSIWIGGERSQWQWIDYLYFLSFVKVGISIVKYIPQVLLNYQRKSTKGWQIWNILLDFAGGTLSIVQLIGDSIAEARAQELSNSNWMTGIVGNPAKFGLGLVSIIFDMIFMVQHYVLYRQPSSSATNNWSHDYERPLLH
ncbi:hypothetical protein ACHAXH_005506 [Discostella pseudostelligera]